MLQNKIYQNFIKEILKTFLIIIFGLSIIAWTVRAVNFLDLIVENGYSVVTYFQYSFLNFLGIFTKFVPLSFLLALIIFILKQIDENEFVILWTSGVKKLTIVNLFFFTSIFILVFYLIFSTLVTPFALNKSRGLLSQDGFNSFIPTIRVQQFSDSFKGFTFLVENKVNNEIANVFIHDSSNLLKNIGANQYEKASKTIIAEKGLVKEKGMILFNGQILSTNKENLKNNLIKFKQLNIDLDNLQTSTIKLPKLQETSTLALVQCLFDSKSVTLLNCKEGTKKEIKTVLNRRIVLPIYIPLVALLCSFLLIRKKSKNNLINNKYSVFFLSFLILLYSELIIRYTGISKVIGAIFILSPLIVTPLIYLVLILKLKRESVTK